MNSILPLLLPVTAMALVASVMISLGVLFINIGHTGTIIVGIGIVVAIPLAGALLTRSR